MAPTGQTTVHWLSAKKPKHSVHHSGSTTGRGFPGAMASVGHSQTHAPQVMQLSTISTATATAPPDRR